MFKAYKAQIPPKWQQFAEAGSGANCKWAHTLVDANGKPKTQKLIDTTIGGNAGTVPEATFNPQSRYAHLTSGSDRTLRDHKDIHFARFLFGPEKKVPIEDLVESSTSESSDDEQAFARKGARRKLKNALRRSSVSSKGSQHLVNSSFVDPDAKRYLSVGGFGSTKKKKTWTEEMQSYLAKAKIRKDAKQRTAKLEEILRHRQRQTAERREKEVEKFAGGGGKSTANEIVDTSLPDHKKKKNYQSMRAQDEEKANWYHALVCAAQELEGDEVRDRLRGQYEERQAKRDAEARAHYEKVLSQSAVADRYKKGLAKEKGTAHTRQVAEANMRAQAETIKFLSHIKDEEQKSDARRKAHAERKEQSDLEAHNRCVTRRQDALDRFQHCLEVRESIEAQHEEQFQQTQAAANERLLLRNLQREEAIEAKAFEEYGGGGSIKKGESKREQRQAAIDSIVTAKRNKISDRQRKAEANYEATMHQRWVNANEHRKKSEGAQRANRSRIEEQSDARAQKAEEIIEKVENIKQFGQRHAPRPSTDLSFEDDSHTAITNGESYLLRQKFVAKNRTTSRSLSPIGHSSSSLHQKLQDTSDIPFNRDFSSAVNTKLAEHQQRTLEIADDLDSYYVEKSEEMYNRDIAFNKHLENIKQAKAVESLEKAANHKAKCDRAFRKKQETEEQIASQIMKKDAELDRRISERRKYLEQKAQEASSKNAQKTGDALYKVNVDNHIKLLQSIDSKQQKHAERKSEQEAVAKSIREEKERVKLGRVASIKQQVEDAARQREEHYEAIAYEKKYRSEVASLARLDGLEDLQQRLAERAAAVNRQREAQRKAEEKSFVEKTAALAKRYKSEGAMVATIKQFEADKWRQKGEELSKLTEDHQTSMLAQLKERNEHTKKYFTERSSTPQPDGKEDRKSGTYSPSKYATMPTRAATSMR